MWVKLQYPGYFTGHNRLTAIPPIIRKCPTISNGLFQVISDAFEGKRPVNRQRMVNKAIKEFTPDIHALRVTALTNSEAEKS